MAEDRDEMLLAYLDGELDGPDKARAERLIAEDADARAFVERQRKLGAQLRQAFDEPMEQDVPQRLLRPFEDAPSVESSDSVVPFRRRQAVAPRRWGELAIAATVALCIGGLIGLNLDFGVSEDGLPGQSLHVAGPIDRDSRLHQMLEQTASFDSATWNEASGHEASAIPLMSFRTTDARVCREYEMLVTLGGAVSSTIGIACRGADGLWTDEILVVSKQTEASGNQASYEAASSGGQVALEGFIAETMQGEPLSPEEERALISGGWR